MCDGKAIDDFSSEERPPRPLCWATAKQVAEQAVRLGRVRWPTEILVQGGDRVSHSVKVFGAKLLGNARRRQFSCRLRKGRIGVGMLRYVKKTNCVESPQGIARPGSLGGRWQDEQRGKRGRAEKNDELAGRGKAQWRAPVWALCGPRSGQIGLGGGPVGSTWLNAAVFFRPGRGDWRGTLDGRDFRGCNQRLSERLDDVEAMTCEVMSSKKRGDDER